MGLRSSLASLFVFFFSDIVFKIVMAKKSYKRKRLKQKNVFGKERVYFK